MSQKKNRSSGASGTQKKNKSGDTHQQQAAPLAKKSPAGVIAGIAAVVMVVAIVVVATNGAGDSAGSSGGVQPTAEEAKYLGRLLPASYEESAVASPISYDATVEMTQLRASTTDTQISVPLADVVSARLVLFQYERADGTPLPLIAYVKPSGKLFVGVSFCPPCQGEWQTIQADGTLTCNACGTKRDLETMAGISGSCRLYPLDEVPVTISNGSIFIDRTPLDSWSAQPLDRQIG